MSHEFRTPLNAIMGFSEIIKNRVLGGQVSPEYIGYAAHIHRSGEHLLHIVNEILDTAKIESGAQPLQQRAIDIRTVILGAASFIEGLAAEKNLKLRLALPAELPMISGDERFSRQVLINLLSNAIKFSPAGADITVSGALPDRTAAWIFPSAIMGRASNRRFCGGWASRSCRAIRHCPIPVRARGSDCPSANATWTFWAANCGWKAWLAAARPRPYASRATSS